MKTTAERIFLTFNKSARKMVDRIERWDYRLGIEENAKRLGITKANAYRMSIIYHLVFKGMYREKKKE